MTKNILLLILLLGVAGCNFFRAPGKDRCNKILSQEKMTGILTDVYLMEGYLLELQTRRPNVRDSAAYFFQSIFDKHEVTQQVFEEALNCYLLHREEIEQIHEDILNNLSIHMGEIQAGAARPGQESPSELPEVPEDMPAPDWQPEDQELEEQELEEQEEAPRETPEQSGLIPAGTH